MPTLPNQICSGLLLDSGGELRSNVKRELRPQRGAQTSVHSDYALNCDSSKNAHGRGGLLPTCRWRRRLSAISVTGSCKRGRARLLCSLNNNK